MSKLPMESRPLRMATEVAQAVEQRLAPLKGDDLKAAQSAVLKVYQSGQQMPAEQWVNAYDQAIRSAVNDK